MLTDGRTTEGRTLDTFIYYKLTNNRFCCDMAQMKRAVLKMADINAECILIQVTTLIVMQEKGSMMSAAEEKRCVFDDI